MGRRHALRAVWVFHVAVSSAWLAPAGTLSVVTQEPAPDLPTVSETEFESLRALQGRGTLRGAGAVATLATHAGFVLAGRRTVKLPSGKKLVSSLFDQARPSLGGRERQGHC